MRPPVGVSRPTSIRAMVVLPEPDSPAIPSEPPAASVKATSRTASVTWWPRLSSPRVVRNVFVSPSTASRGVSDMRQRPLGDQLLAADARGHAARHDLAQRRPALEAALAGERAAGG